MWIDLERWPRRGTWEHYRNYELPWFNLTAQVDVTETRAWCRDHRQSFFLATWWLTLSALTPIPAFCQRVRGDRVWQHSRLAMASTVLADDDTVRFCRLEPADDFGGFAAAAGEVVARAKRSAPALVDQADASDDLVFGTVIPWVSFTQVTHARRLGAPDSIPRVAVGKAEEAGGRVRMPVSIEAHHAVVDGLHVGRFFAALESGFAAPDHRLGAG